MTILEYCERERAARTTTAGLTIGSPVRLAEIAILETAFRVAFGQAAHPQHLRDALAVLARSLNAA